MGRAYIAPTLYLHKGARFGRYEALLAVCVARSRRPDSLVMITVCSDARPYNDAVSASLLMKPCRTSFSVSPELRARDRI